MTLPNDATRKWTYDSTYSQPLTYEDALGNDTVFTLDSDGNVLTVRRIAGLGDDTTNSESDDAVTTYTYTAAPVNSGDLPQGLVATVTDPLSRVNGTKFTDVRIPRSSY